MNKISGLVCGLLFGFGLAASGMTNTAKVIGFLDIFGAWDPDLLFVMGAAVVTAIIGFHFIGKRQSPLFENEFSQPNRTIINRQLIIGAMLFGIGWGLYGYCPGPAVAALAYPQPVTVVFLLTMLVGMLLGNKLTKAELR